MEYMTENDYYQISNLRCLGEMINTIELHGPDLSRRILDNEFPSLCQGVTVCSVVRFTCPELVAQVPVRCRLYPGFSRTPMNQESERNKVSN